MPNTESILENDMLKILQNFMIQTEIQTSRPSDNQ